MSHFSRQELILRLHPLTKVHVESNLPGNPWIHLEDTKGRHFSLPGEGKCHLSLSWAWKEGDHGYLFSKEFDSFIEVKCVKVLDQRWLFFAGNKDIHTYAFPPFKVPVIYKIE